MKKKIFLILISLCISIHLLKAQDKVTVFGIVTDELNIPVSEVNIRLIGTSNGTTTNYNGYYEFSISKNKNATLEFSHISTETHQEKLKFGAENRIELNVQLRLKEMQIGDVEIKDRRRNSAGVTYIERRHVEVLPNASGGIEALIKTFPGVWSSSELSSQYSVRGGNYDENLVYVNDIEIYRPMLVRSGEQEGLSFVNPDMIASVMFSSGGFDAKYGDKMSSVLDITYRRPIEFGATVSAGLLGGAVTLEGCSKDTSLTFISSVRYKTSQYLLNTLDTKGDYKPQFIDFQTYITYKLSPKAEMGFLGNYSSNIFNLVPENRTTTFGTISRPVGLKMYFDGQEKDQFASLTAAAFLKFIPNKDTELKYTASVYQTTEYEAYDILAQYFLNELNKDFESTSVGDSALNKGVGSYLRHARNLLQMSVINIGHRGFAEMGNNFLQWGVSAQREIIDDKLNEWTMLDSADFSIPYTSETIQLYRSHYSDNQLITNRANAYFQNKTSFRKDSVDYEFTAGIRAHYWDFNKKINISPRLSLVMYPNLQRRNGEPLNMMFRFATGLYYQPAFYKEIRDFQGNLNYDVKTQRSLHFVIGNEYTFLMWERPFKLVTELYYKHLSNLIPYEFDNVRINYFTDKISNGYATGLDMKLNGHFVNGVDSWVSLSVMNTKEDIAGDAIKFIPRPTNQAFTLGLFFQDYFPNNRTYKVHLNILYGSALRTGPPQNLKYKSAWKIPAYRRVDIGFSKLVFGSDELVERQHRYFKSLWITGEVLNLLDINNVISYLWVTSLNRNPTDRDSLYGNLAVPNYLTGRRFNIRFIAKF